MSIVQSCNFATVAPPYVSTKLEHAVVSIVALSIDFASNPIDVARQTSQVASVLMCRVDLFQECDRTNFAPVAITRSIGRRCSS